MGKLLKDDLGNRMKKNYEDRTRHILTRRTNTVIRIDGKAFHSYTQHCTKPFDKGFMADMAETAKELCVQIQGAKFAYTQSDEISIFLNDCDTLTTEAWFDNNLQKMCSVSASIATAKFNVLRAQRYNFDSLPMALFDSRVFQIPETAEVANYFLWRCQDAARNSIQMLAQSKFSHAQLQGKNTADLHEMLHSVNVNWNDLEPEKKRGTLIAKKVADTWHHWEIVPIPDEHGFEYWNGLVKSVTKANV